eukprot:363984-Chlamydomonas_euryale.AAC.17
MSNPPLGPACNRRCCTSCGRSTQHTAQKLRARHSQVTRTAYAQKASRAAWPPSCPAPPKGIPHHAHLRPAPSALVVCKRCQSGHLAQQPHNLLVLHLARLVDVLPRQRWVLLGVARAESAYAGQDDAHGVRIGWQRRHRSLDLHGDLGVPHHRLVERRQLRRRGRRRCQVSRCWQECVHSVCVQDDL